MYSHCLQWLCWQIKILYPYIIVIFIVIIIIIIITIFLTPLYRIFTTMHLKQTMFLDYTILQLFCCYALSDTCHVIFHVECFVLTSALPALCVQFTVWLFCRTPWFSAFQVYGSGIFWIILRWFQLPLVLLVSLFFYIPHSLYSIIIIIIIIIIMCYHLCVDYLQLCLSNKPLFYDI